MKQYKNLVIMVAVFIIVIGGAVFAYNKLADKVDTAAVPTNSTNHSQSNFASNFTVYDIDGNKIELADNIGKPVVVNFWATWCPPCKAELPYFNQIYNELSDEVTFMMVDLTDGNNETVDGVTEFIQGNSYTFPVYFDKDANAAYSYHVSSIPMTLFIDKSGYLVEYHIGAMDEQTLREYIGFLLTN